MSSIIKAFFKNKKINLIYILLIFMIMVVITAFQIISAFFDFNINEKYGIYKENRTYYLYNINEHDIDILKTKFDFENIQEDIDSFDNNGYYTITLKSYKDTQKFIKYLDRNKINGIPDGNAKNEEINIIKKSILIFNIIKITVIIISFIILSFLIKNIFLNDKKNILLFKIIGFNDIRILFIIMIRFLIILLFSIGLSFITFFFIKNVIIILNKSFIANFMKSISIFHINFLGIVVTFLILMVNIILNLMFTKKDNILEVINN